MVQMPLMSFSPVRESIQTELVPDEEAYPGTTKDRSVAAMRTPPS